MNINVVPAIPEIILAVMACVILLVGAFVGQRRAVVYYLTQLALLFAAIATVGLFITVGSSGPLLVFYRTFVLDNLSLVLDFFVLLCTFFVFIYSRTYNDQRQIPSNEFYVLGLLAVIGMLVLISAHSLITLFLGVELLSIPMYAMVAMRRKEGRCVEAAIKFFIIGALATGLLLYGFSMLFGASQSLDIADIAQYFSKIDFTTNYIATFGLVFAVAGLAFKLGVAPFHMWVPDVFEGAPNSVTLFISTAPKIAGFGMAIRLLVGALPSLHPQWQEMLIVLSIWSMGIGNFAAIAQTNIKRMLAYSSIAHGGYMLLGMVAATPRGYAASMFYILNYAIMNLGAFGIVTLLSHAGCEMEDISDFKALNNTHPWLAFMMLIVMFSLAGVPPLTGFIAKIGLLEALIDVHMVWLAVLTIIFAIVGAYYYIRVVKVMYFEPFSERTRSMPLNVSKSHWIAISLNGVAVLVLGIFPGALYTLCHLSF